MILLCKQKILKVFVSIIILIENITTFNMDWQTIVNHPILSQIRYQKCNKFSILCTWWKKLNSLNEIFIITPIGKI